MAIIHFQEMYKNKLFTSTYNSDSTLCTVLIIVAATSTYNSDSTYSS